MRSTGSGAHEVVLDACVLLNLAATGSLAEILKASFLSVAVPDAVVAEVRWLRRGGRGEDRDELDRVDLRPLVEAGVLRITELAGDGVLALFVHLAAEIDDGEAAAAALALSTGATLATDDRKCRRVVSAVAPGCELTDTPECLAAWVRRCGVADADAGVALRRIEDRARYWPPRAHPLCGWWEGLLGSEPGEPPR